ncbi:hypothetical protein AM501_06680 [Aneurinibacillus migulanus]|uniref:DUF2577 domain-containing protein n=1 Tax=Aneurinibacillus migulanus TaxID=47500 RepID=UPI0005B8EBDC|nr:DUF2577 domain-containing protein [Aneurinibacillus migulanus]KIV55262.1 hypothetical protein TS64_11985 [Aneurinibacillus migulanus]KPD09036.1 hypothetical protein AM501_06680 [Aneurinibacillus migulanus]
METSGNPYTDLVQLMKEHGHNKDVDIVFGTITAPPPNIRVKVDNETLEIEKDDVVILQYLTKHKRKIRITSNTASLSKEEATSIALDGSPYKHKHDIEVTNGSLTVTEAEIEYLDELKAGERVVLAEIEKGQKYVILDREVIY